MLQWYSNSNIKIMQTLQNEAKKLPLPVHAKRMQKLALHALFLFCMRGKDAIQKRN
jgi:hypothetical protein